MKNKKISAIVALVIFLIQIITTNINLVTVNAAEIISFPFITGVTILDANGNDLGNNIGKSDEIHINYTWAIPNDKSVNEGDTYTVQLPSQINIIADINQPINDKDSNKIADMHIGTDGKVIITFTQYASEHSDVSGNFFVDCHFKASEIGNLNPTVISFSIKGMADPVTINVSFQQPDPSVTKEGTYDPLTDEITWRVTVNKEGTLLDNASLEDVINSGQEFVMDSVEVDNQQTYSYYDGISRKMVCDLGTITTEQVITFRTSVHNDLSTKVQGSYYYSNTAVINYEDKGLPKKITSNAKTVLVNVKYISKSGNYDPLTKQINWVIKVNESGRTVNNAKITDDIPAGLKLVNGSLKVGDTIADTTILDEDYSYSYTDNSSMSTFGYTLGDISKIKTISYSTQVDSTIYNSNIIKNFNNIAYLTGSGIPNGTSANTSVGVQPNIIQKQGVGYDSSKGIITWKITINDHKTLIDTGAVVKDTIPLGQSYVANSAKLDGTPIDDSGYTAALQGDTTKTGIFAYTFSSAFSDKHTIEFQTQVTDAKNYEANYNGYYSNKVNIKATGVDQEASGSQYVDSQIINKTGTAYDYATREITWKIIVNRNKMPITNAIITDVVSAGQEYIAGSATIDDGNNGSFNSEEDIKDNGKVVYTFNSTINKTYTIYLKTKIIDLNVFNQNGNKNFNNTASITGDEIPTGSNNSSTGTRSIKNSVISKTAIYAWGNAYIDWVVETNSNFSIPLAGATITDDLQEGLSLDTDTVELYKLVVNSDGTATQGTKVTLNSDNVKYDPTTRKFIFIFPKDSGTGAFRLKFRTNATKTSTFTNSVKFSGSAVTQSANSSSVGVWYSSGGGSGTGVTGSIVVAKCDSNDTSKKLSGAVFQLLDQYGNVKVTSLTTGSDGAVLFDKLKFDIDYYVKEITPPEGYNPSNEIYKFQVKNTVDGKNIIYNYKDNKITGRIEINKTDENGSPLQGAEFSLYEATDTEFLYAKTTATSDSNGLVQFNGVSYGSYTIKETKAPTGYNISSQVFTAIINEDGKTVKASPDTVSNIKIRGDIEFKKTGEDGKGLEGAEFSLYKDTDTNFTNPIKTANSDSTGGVKFSSVEYGNYMIKETKAPVGYNLNSQIISAKISENGNTVQADPYKVSDTKIRGDIELKKTGEDGKGLLGAEFSLYADTDVNFTNPIYKAVSDSVGDVKFSNAEYGRYKIKETKAPLGYNLNSQVLSVTISENGKEVQADPYTVSDTKIRGEIELKKTGEDGKGLEGAEFSLYEDTDTNFTNPMYKAVSSSTGDVKFSNVEYGSYKIKETKAPFGYNLNLQVLTVAITNNGEIVQVNPYEISNTKIRGNIEIHKVGEDTNPLQGVEFKLYKTTDILFENPLSTATSDSNGDVKFTGVEYGMYKIKETKQLIGYNLFLDIIVVSITEEGKTVKANPYEISNTKVMGDIELKKIGEDGKGLKDAEFSLYENADINFTSSVKIAKSDSNGIVKFRDVEYGSYKIKETKAPNGYNLNLQVINATISNNGEVVQANPNTVFDTKIRGNIELKKTGEDRTGLEGAEFSLYTDIDANFINPIYKAISSSTGEVIFSDVEYGSYKIKETKAPVGYNLNLKVLTVAIVNNGETVQVNPYEFSDVKIRGNLDVRKTGEDGKGLKGAEFSLYADTDTNFSTALKTVVSDNNGYAEFSCVEYGNYKIKETKAPIGYNLSSEVLDATVNENTDKKTLSTDLYIISDTKIRGNIELKKTGEDGRGLEGAEFSLYADTDTNFTNPIKVANSDSNGSVKFSNVEYGNYSIKETKAPIGYKINSKGITSVISNNGETVQANPYEISNTKIRGNLEINKVGEDGKVLKGAEFSIYAGIDGNCANPLSVVISDSNGVAKFNNLQYGAYIVKETKAPDGYSLSLDKIEVIVSEDGATYSYKIKNTEMKGSIEVIVTDKEGKILPYTEVSLYDKNVKLIGETITDKNGIAKFANVAYGIYTIMQTKVIDGYIINDNPVTVKVSAPEIYRIAIQDDQRKIGDKIIANLIKTGDSTSTVRLIVILWIFILTIISLILTRKNRKA